MEGSNHSAELEKVTPAKLVVAMFIRDYCILYKSKSFNEVIRNEVTAKHRKQFGLFILKLVQGVDLQLQDFLAQFHEYMSSLTVPKSLLPLWKQNFITTVENGVGGLMDLCESLQKLLLMELHIPVLHRSSVVGLYLRRIMLCFEKLSFSEVSQLGHNFHLYFETGKRVLDRVIPDRNTNAAAVKEASRETQTDMDVSSDMEISLINDPQMKVESCVLDESDDPEFKFCSFSTQRKEEDPTKKQAELYIAQQVELLHTVEPKADNPKNIQNMVNKILKQNPEMSEAHYLAYLNCLRVKEYCGAIYSLHRAFNRSGSNGDFQTNNRLGSSSTVSQEELDRGLQYAALNLASLHAWFHNRGEAVSALKEAIMMAQEANDHVCLQHALTWLYRIRSDNIETLMERCIAKSSDLNLSYLTSLGIQSFSQFAAIVGARPSIVLDVLTKSDILNCQHSIIELITSSYSQKAAFWSLYGRTHLSCIVSQLLLNLDTSDPIRNGLYVQGEASALALSNVARHLYFQGHLKASDKVFEKARSMFPGYTQLSSIWRLCQLQVDFQKSLHHTNWHAAQKLISEVAALDTKEPPFLKMNLYLWKGDASTATEAFDEIASFHEKSPYPAGFEARMFIHQAELFCLSGSYADAIRPLTSALSLCKQHQMEFFIAIINLHLAHIQLQLGMPQRALEITEKQMASILSHGSLFECSRARMLLAKCIVASSASEDVATRRTQFLKAIKHLRLAMDGFTTMESHHRSKDVLYMIARLYNELGMMQERNQTAAEFKKLDEQYPTNATSKLAMML